MSPQFLSPKSLSNLTYLYGASHMDPFREKPLFGYLHGTMLVTTSDHVRAHPFAQTGNCWSDSAEICPKMTLVHHYHHLSFSRHTTHNASTVFLQLVRFCATFWTSLHNRWAEASLFQVILGLSSFLFPSGVQNIASLVMLPMSFLNMCPTHRHLLVNSSMMSSCSHMVLTSAFEIFWRHSWMRTLAHPTVFLCHCLSYLSNIPLNADHPEPVSYSLLRSFSQ